MANSDMMRETVESNGANLERVKKQIQTRKRNQGLKPVSEDQKKRNERLKRDRAFALDVMKKTQGFFSCQECGGVQEPNDLDWHHILRRSRGGQDHWSNMMLVCRPCHRRLDGNDLRWTQDPDAFDAKFADGAPHPDEDPAHEHANAHLRES